MNEPLLHHVYLLRSDICPDKYYKGYTGNINKRLSEHNQGKVAGVACFEVPLTGLF